MMIALIVVTIVLGGIALPSSQPAWVSPDGFVYAPIDPIVRSIAQSVQVDPRDLAVTIEGNGKRAVLASPVDVVAQADGTIYVRLGTAVRDLGGSASFDSVRKVVTIEMPGPSPVISPTPFNPANPTVAPTMVFTPQPTTTPRSTPSGVPQPRRTPVLVAPSFP
ncbi:MAG: hypothetical protein ABSE64_14800 [Vulcanimicrobiaceae bacterium]|jgi:hypothetical protein